MPDGNAVLIRVVVRDKTKYTCRENSEFRPYKGRADESHIINNKMYSNKHGLLFTFSLLALSSALRMHLATQAAYECRPNAHTVLRYARIPLLRVFHNGNRHSASETTIKDVAIDPQAGAYLVLRKSQCDALGIGRFVGRTGDFAELFDDAGITLFDVKNKGLSVQSRVRVACKSAGNPVMGLGALTAVMGLEAEGEDVYSVLNSRMASQVRIRRAM